MGPTATASASSASVAAAARVDSPLELTAPVFLLRPLPESDRLTLDGPEGRHAARVRRLRAGERVDLTDGEGLLAECVVAVAGRDELEMEVVRRVTTAIPQPRIVVVQALVKGDRSELAVELLTEVGVDEIVPWAAQRCVATWVPERSARRWEQTAAEASKQARRSRWPVIGELATTPAVEQRLATAAGAYVLHESADKALVTVVEEARSGVPDWQGELVLVVGPEGGLTDTELAGFAAAGASPVRLGPNVLRASTAGCAAAAVLLSVCGRWK
jgi:16S rRNA (uracil1498-N3)-methyltransferase